jgi:hypothetical protein
LDAKTASASSELPASEEGNGESEPERGERATSEPPL